jgi:uncharacterized membrane protein
MAAGKLIVLAFGVLLLLYLVGFFGPGPLIPGLGPVFDQAMPLAIVVLLALAAAPWLLKTFRKTEVTLKPESGSLQPEEILRERYARGELGRNQFLFMLEDLRTPNPRKTPNGTLHER